MKYWWSDVFQQQECEEMEQHQILGAVDTFHFCIYSKFSDVLQWWGVNDWSCSLQLKMLRFLHAQWIFWILKINSQAVCSSCDLQKLNHPVGTVGFLFLHWSQKSSTCGLSDSCPLNVLKGRVCWVCYRVPVNPFMGTVQESCPSASTPGRLWLRPLAVPSSQALQYLL